MIHNFARLRDPRALDILPRALQVAEATNLPDEAQRFYMNIGDFYFFNGNIEKALENYEADLALSDKIVQPHTGYLATLHYSIGNVKNIQGDPAGALPSLQKALDFATARKEDWLISECLLGIGRVYANEKNFDRAIAVAEQALAPVLKMNSFEHIAKSYLGEGKAKAGRIIGVISLILWSIALLSRLYQL